MLNLADTLAFVVALTGSPDTVMSWRALHDTDKGVQGVNMRASVTDAAPWMHQMQTDGYGIFAIISAMQPSGQKLSDVQSVRAHFVDLDNPQAPMNLSRASQWLPPPSFVVNSSPNKHHVYWQVQSYCDNNYFSGIQRKLARLFDGDPSVIDATRVMRVPGTWHLKNSNEPWLVTCGALAGYGITHSPIALAEALEGITALEPSRTARRPLGDPALSAPDVFNCLQSLQDADPNGMTHIEWATFTAAWKQAVWLHMSPDEARAHWDQWCARYDANDQAANDKLWRAVTESSIGWQALRKRSPSVLFTPTQAVAGAIPLPELPPVEAVSAAGYGELIYPHELASYFTDCYHVRGTNELSTPHGLLQQTQFNIIYGGHRYIITSAAAGDQMTKSAWEAATNSTVFKLPHCHFVRYLPEQAYMQRTVNSNGEISINTYKARVIDRTNGDPSPWVNHVRELVGDDEAFEHLCDYLAHNLLYPGFKIPWAPLIVSEEGAGKNVIQYVMARAFENQMYTVPCEDLTNGDGKFNAWMREKLIIFVDEIKVYEDRSSLINMLKTWISERRIQTQAKGSGQIQTDNLANYLFFSNFKNAIPITRNSRRFMPIFSPLNSLHAIEAAGRGLKSGYFDRFLSWFYNGGDTDTINWLMSRPVERGKIPMRAPHTKSSAEAWLLAQTPLERMINEAIEEGVQGFRGGWVGSKSVRQRIRVTGAVTGRNITEQTIQTCLEGMGYVDCGIAPRSWPMEDTTKQDMRSRLFHKSVRGDPAVYGNLQGWGENNVILDK